MNNLQLSSLAISMLMFTIAACGEADQEGLDCKTGALISEGQDQYCIYRAAVTETGFKCPGEVPNLNDNGLVFICSKEETIAPERVERLEDNAPSDWNIKIPAQAPSSLDGKTEIAAGSSFPTADNKIFAYWSVTSSQSDYIYLFGQGTATSTGFTINFESDPPVGALNGYGIGVAIVGGLFPSNTAYTPMKLADQALFYTSATTQALTDRYAIIYKRAGSTEGPEWSKAFPDGYSCGKGVPAVSGTVFDTFEKIDCAEVILRVDTMFQIVNWT